MKKNMTIMLICLGVLFGGIFLWKLIVTLMLRHYFSTHGNPAMTVSTTKIEYTLWQNRIKAVGSTRAILGVNVTAQTAGMIQSIYFTPGAVVKEGTMLVQQNADPEIAQLHSLQANAALAKITFMRDKAQYKVHAVSKQQLDTDEQNLKSAIAQVAGQSATIAKLTIKAPFTGRLGISRVNPGQYLNPGDQVVSLQQLDPIYVDFTLPQQDLVQLAVGQVVHVKSDAFPGKTFTGKITTIDPLVDVNTRNIQAEATVMNPRFELTPGMFTTVEVIVGKPQPFLTLPQAAVSFNSYGDIVYVVNETGKDADGKPIYQAKQAFVKTGQTRGDQITILQGVKAGETIVTSGQLKLKNDSVVTINNSVQPDNSPTVDLPDDHKG